MKSQKEETLHEFLMRGGVIKKIPPKEYKTDNMVKITTVYIPQLLDLSTGEMFYSEFKPIEMERIKDKVNLDVLPLDLLQQLGLR